MKKIIYFLNLLLICNCCMAQTNAIESRNKQLALLWSFANSNHNADSCLLMMSPNVIEYNDGGMAPEHGKGAMRPGFTAWYNAFPDYKGTNFTAYANGDSVVVIADWSATFKNDLGPLKATGKHVTYKDADIFTFDKNGLITSHRGIQSFKGIMLQAGLVLQ